MNNYKITLQDGTQVSVTKDIYDKILEQNNPKLYYNSASKGKVKISDMADEWLKNAIIKKYKTLLETELTVWAKLSLAQVSSRMAKGIQAQADVELVSMHEEAKKRANRISYAYGYSSR